VSTPPLKQKKSGKIVEEKEADQEKNSTECWKKRSFSIDDANESILMPTERMPVQSRMTRMEGLNK
jgi:hypothetical protein